MDDDDLVFLDEDEDTGEESNIVEQWNILIVDDEPEVHRVTKLALDGFVFSNKSLNFVSAYTGAEAREILSDTDLDIAVILLDVVMETDHAGLDTAQWIREELKNMYVRIVLRTGQPGQAPEREVISSYDINDYKEKTELTARKLYTLMFATLRSYRDIRAIANNKRGLKKIIDATANIFEHQSLEKFTSGALLQLSALFHLNQGAMYGRSDDGIAAASLNDGEIKVLAGTGKFCGQEGKALEDVLPKDYAMDELKSYITDGKSGFIGNTYVGVFRTKTGIVNLLFLLGADHPDVDNGLIEIFARNIGDPLLLKTYNFWIRWISLSVKLSID